MGRIAIMVESINCPQSVVRLNLLVTVQALTTPALLTINTEVHQALEEESPAVWEANHIITKTIIRGLKAASVQVALGVDYHHKH